MVELPGGQYTSRYTLYYSLYSILLANSLYYVLAVCTMFYSNA